MKPSERFEEIKKLKSCYNCFRRDYITSKCPSRNTCFVKGCTERQHTTLRDHFVGEKKDSKQKTEGTRGGKSNSERGNADEKKGGNGFSGMMKLPQQSKYLQIVPVASNVRFLLTNAFLDAGSQSTLIKSDAAQFLKLRGKKRTINIATVKDRGQQLTEVSLEVTPRDRKTHLKIN